MMDMADYAVPDRALLSSFFPKLPDRMNKGRMGRVLAICGSYDAKGSSMSGAAYFAASAAYRTGAGIVEVFTPRENYGALACRLPEAVYSLYGCDEEEAAVAVRLKTAILRSNAVILGCGLGRSPLAAALVKTVLQTVRVPLILDADGLNLLSEHPDWWAFLSDAQRKQTLLTPHPGEMARLCGASVSEILLDLPGYAKAFAGEKGVLCLLKDHNTAVSDGARLFLNQSGNPGMATGGMGDLLAGILGSMASRAEKGSDLLALTAAGAYLHGVAGDRAASKIGEYGLLASDLLNEIPLVIAENFAKM